MRISTKGRYALRMFIDLAQHQNGTYVALGDISKRQGISKKYLEQIIPIFSKTDMLKASRGSQGGYMLAKAPEKYTVGEILRLTEGELTPVDCAAQDPVECERSALCPTLFVWQGLYRAINGYLDSVTLQDIIDRAYSDEALTYII